MKCRLLGIVALFTLVVPLLHAADKNPAHYPLRIHIFGRDATTFYRWREVEDSKGVGRADLYADGGVHGVDFSFDCPEKLRASFGYETYAARWKKPGIELTVLFPEFGKQGSYWTCDLHTDVKSFAYARHNGGLVSEPVPAFEQWMVKHNYDPEHGRETPTPAAPAPGGTPPASGTPPHP